MLNKLYLTRAEDTQESIDRAVANTFDNLKLNFGKKISEVIIKPNLCYYWDYSTGYTTDPKIVSGIIDVVRREYPDADIKIVESDASAMRTKNAFRVLGYTKLSDEKKVGLFNLSEDEPVEEEVVINNKKIKFKVPKSILGADLFINVPKLKIMRETYITCGLKNVFGCIHEPRKIKYHPVLNEIIVGVNKILVPDVTIVDGVIGLSRLPTKINLIMGSDSPFATDWIASKIMGYNPEGVPFLRLAVKEKLGDPKNLEVLGDDYKSYRDKFPKENNFVSKNSFKVMLKLLNIYSSITGDIIPPVLDTL